MPAPSTSPAPTPSCALSATRTGCLPAHPDESDRRPHRRSGPAVFLPDARVGRHQHGAALSAGAAGGVWRFPLAAVAVAAHQGGGLRGHPRPFRAGAERVGRLAPPPSRAAAATSAGAAPAGRSTGRRRSCLSSPIPCRCRKATSAVGDADELAIPLLAIAFALGLALASLYVVYAAPMLFAELLVDGALSYALYRRIKAADSPHWLESAVRRTALPFVLTGVFVSITGAAMAAYAPGAHSIGQVMQHQSNNR